jgi:hypothetical protein
MLDTANVNVLAVLSGCGMHPNVSCRDCLTYECNLHPKEEISGFVLGNNLSLCPNSERRRDMGLKLCVVGAGMDAGAIEQLLLAASAMGLPPVTVIEGPPPEMEDHLVSFEIVRHRLDCEFPIREFTVVSKRDFLEKKRRCGRYQSKRSNACQKH